MDFKWLRVPESNNTKDVKVAQLWEVRWNSLKFNRMFNDEYPDARPEMETFLTEDEASAFAQSLSNARRLLKISGMSEITVRKAT